MEKKKVVLEFQLALKSEPVVMTKEDDTKIEYHLKELSGADRDFIVQAMRKRLGKGKDTIENIEGMQAELLSKTLYDENDVRLTEVQVQKLPSTMLNALYVASQDLSELGDTDSEELEDAKEALFEIITDDNLDDETTVVSLVEAAKVVAKLESAKND